MTILSRPLAAFAAILWPRSDMGSAGIARTGKTTGYYPSALIAGMRQKSDGPPPMYPLVLAMRDDLAAQIKAAPPRSHRKAELTAHAKMLVGEILSRGAFGK